VASSLPWSLLVLGQIVNCAKELAERVAQGSGLMYDFISIVCRFFIALLFLGYLAIAVAIFWGLLGLPIRRWVKKIFAGTLTGTQDIFRFCADNLKDAEFKSKSDAKGNCVSHATPEKGVPN
jgi:hypothetical protein